MLVLKSAPFFEEVVDVGGLPDVGLVVESGPPELVVEAVFFLQATTNKIAPRYRNRIIVLSFYQKGCQQATVIQLFPVLFWGTYTVIYER